MRFVFARLARVLILVALPFAAGAFDLVEMENGTVLRGVVETFQEEWIVFQAEGETKRRWIPKVDLRRVEFNADVDKNLQFALSADGLDSRIFFLEKSVAKFSNSTENVHLLALAYRKKGDDAGYAKLRDSRGALPAFRIWDAYAAVKAGDPLAAREILERHVAEYALSDLERAAHLLVKSFVAAHFEPRGRAVAACKDLAFFQGTNLVETAWTELSTEGDFASWKALVDAEAEGSRRPGESVAWLRKRLGFGPVLGTGSNVMGVDSNGETSGRKSFRFSVRVPGR